MWSSAKWETTKANQLQVSRVHSLFLDLLETRSTNHRPAVYLLFVKISRSWNIEKQKQNEEGNDKNSNYLSQPAL